MRDAGQVRDLLQQLLQLRVRGRGHPHQQIFAAGGRVDLDDLRQVDEAVADGGELALFEFEPDERWMGIPTSARSRFGRKPVSSPLVSMRFIRDCTVLRATPSELASSATLMRESLPSSPSNCTSSLSMLSTLGTSGK